jgi:hypothetical protein
MRAPRYIGGRGCGPSAPTAVTTGWSAAPEAPAGRFRTTPTASGGDEPAAGVVASRRPRVPPARPHVEFELYSRPVMSGARSRCCSRRPRQRRILQ